MKKINLLAVIMVVVVLVASFNSSSAQTKAASKPYIEAFDDGRVLNQNDIKFLNSISGGTADAKSATVGGKTFKAGQKLNANDAAIINKAKSNYRKQHKMDKATDAKAIDKSRGQENCYWYLYCDGYGNCYYIWYCD